MNCLRLSIKAMIWPFIKPENKSDLMKDHICLEYTLQRVCNRSGYTSSSLKAALRTYPPEDSASSGGLSNQNKEVISLKLRVLLS